MAVIDKSLIFMQDVAVGASVNSSVLDLGGKLANVNPLYIDVKLTTGVTAGSVVSVKVQSSDTEAFTKATDEIEVTIAKSATEQKSPCQLAQFFCPIRPGNRYVRLVATGDKTTAPVGGKLWAYMSPDIQVPL